MLELLLALVVTFIAMDGTAAAQSYRTLSSLGGGTHPAVLLVSGCSGFVAFNGFNPYEDRAAELQAAGYQVIFVDYLGRYGLKDCAGITLAQVIRISSKLQSGPVGPAWTGPEFRSLVGRMAATV
jgi:dienelactone hydrolase